MNYLPFSFFSVHAIGHGIKVAFSGTWNIGIMEILIFFFYCSQVLRLLHSTFQLWSCTLKVNACLYLPLCTLVIDFCSLLV